MRTVLLGWLFLLSSAAVAADLNINVTDSHSAAVPYARVELYRGDSDAAGVQTTSLDGKATFRQLSPGSYSVRVLAPGFGVQKKNLEFPQETSLAVQLAPAVPGETVVVTATRTPVNPYESGASVLTLENDELENKQPTSVAEALRFLPGAIITNIGQRGGLTSLFVRGGDSRYNKVLIDGVPANDVGGLFNPETVPTYQVDRLEFVRGAESTLYGSDAMTSVVQVFTATGRTPSPEIRFGAEGGNFSTAHGYASFAGAWRALDYNLFGDQFNTEGDGPNAGYSSSLQGANVGARLTNWASLRFRIRHNNSRTGVQGQWNFNGNPLLPPDLDQRTRRNVLLGSADLNLAAGTRWQHRLRGYGFNHRRFGIDTISDRDCFNFFIDCPFINREHLTRAGFDYQGEFTPRRWARTIFGYEFENENGFLTENFTGLESDPGNQVHGLRRNHAAYGQQFLSYQRLAFWGGLRYVHNESFGDRAVPRASLSVLLLRGADVRGPTRLRFAYGEGIKAPRFEETFGIGSFILPNPDLKAEQNRSLEGGFQQDFGGGRYSLSANYYHNLFRNQITFQSFGPPTFAGEFVNLNRSLAHGAEVEFHARPRSALSISTGYVYTSTEILRAPLAFSPLTAEGRPLLRRPRHSGALLVSYSAARWGSTLGGTFMGRRPDSDFLFCPSPPVAACPVPAIDHAAGYARFDMGGWYALNRYMTAYLNLENAFDKQYEDAVGFPGLGINFRAGMRFRLGGE
ncbi:MAG: TonB-dependent receptor [Acidobacteriales bacterium]|nr:TonB-dependent receptor [Terriglobales bacterium]